MPKFALALGVAAFFCPSHVRVLTGCRDWTRRRPNKPGLWLPTRAITIATTRGRLPRTPSSLYAQGGAGRTRSGKLPTISPNVPRVVRLDSGVATPAGGCGRVVFYGL